MINRILPLLNKLLPNDIAFKGLQKLDPRIGRFLNIAGAAYGADAALDFLRNKFQGSPQVDQSQMRPEEQAAQAQIANSRQLPNFIMGTAKGIAGGAGLAGLGAQALGSITDQEIPMGGPTDNPIKKFQDSYPDIANALISTMQQGQPPQAAAAILKGSSAFAKEVKKIEKEVGKNFVDYITDIFGTPEDYTPKPSGSMGIPTQPAQQPQQMQGNNLDDQLMMALDKILKM